MKHSGFNQKIVTHVLNNISRTRPYIFLSEIILKFVIEFLVLRFLFDPWSMHLVGCRLADGRWSLVDCSVGRYSVVGGRLIGGFKKATFQTMW